MGECNRLLQDAERVLPVTFSTSVKRISLKRFRLQVSSFQRMVLDNLKPGTRNQQLHSRASDEDGLFEHHAGHIFLIQDVQGIEVPLG